MLTLIWILGGCISGILLGAADAQPGALDRLVLRATAGAVTAVSLWAGWQVLS